VAGSRRAQILEVAAPLFARRGFHGVSIDELGAAVGVSGPALYRHFPGKESILAELLLDVSRRLLAGGRERVAASPDPKAALVALVEGHVAFALAEPALITLQARDLDAVPDTARQRVVSLQRRYVDLWVDTIVAVTGAARPVALAGAHATFGLINSTPHSARLPAPAMAGVLRATALAALAALPEVADPGG
jgi:AcrR family transcriptional regulator